MSVNLLFRSITNNGSCYNFRKDKHHIDLKDQTLNGRSIKSLLENLKVALSVSKSEVDINIHSKEIADDAVIQQMDTTIALAFENGIEIINLCFDKIIPSSPYVDHLTQSVFGRNKNKDRRYRLFKDDFLKNYYKESYSEKNYFRYYVKKEKRDSLINRILSDANSFFAINVQDQSYAVNLAKAFTEMVDNVRHANSDCIATIKFSDRLVSRSNNKPVKGYFLYVCDISEVSLFGTLKEAIIKNNIYGKTKEIVEKSYPYHKNYFGIDGYSFDKYCLISVFQNSLTTSSLSGETGGRGLTDLISTLTKGSLMYNCYVLSGDYVLYFKNNFTVIDDNGNISFNDFGNYYTSIPSSSSFGRTAFYYPGTIFLLEIIVEDKK